MIDFLFLCNSKGILVKGQSKCQKKKISVIYIRADPFIYEDWHRSGFKVPGNKVNHIKAGVTGLFYS